MWRVVRRRGGKPVPLRRSSTARVSRAPKKGAFDRSAWLRRGQENQRQQEAAHPGRYAGLDALVHAADVQDRDGGVLLMGSLFGLYPFLLKLYADSGYQGAKFRTGLAAACAQINLETVKRSDVGRFVVLPKRWIRAPRHDAVPSPVFPPFRRRWYGHHRPPADRRRCGPESASPTKATESGVIFIQDRDLPSAIGPPAPRLIGTHDKRTVSARGDVSWTRARMVEHGRAVN